MPVAMNHDGDQVSQPNVQVHLCDPALVVAYFFNGAADHEPAIREHLGAIFSALAEELRIYQPFPLSVSRTDLRHIRFARFQWNSESLATLVQFYVAPSQVWCIQLGLPVCRGPTPLEEALAAWQGMEGRLKGCVGHLIEVNGDGAPVGPDRACWGSSRLYWALSDELAGALPLSSDLARAVQSIAGPTPDLAQEAGPGEAGGLPPVRCQPYDPLGHVGDYGTLWRLDQPAAGDGPYQAAWLLLSPQAQNEAVALGYILNCRFAVGEAYLCKAHDQAAEYAYLAQGVKDGIRSVQMEIMELLALEGPCGFAPEQIGEARNNLRLHGDRIHQVAVAYSQLLFALSLIDRLHLTVRTNLENFQQMAAEFTLWDHPASQAEIGRLQGVLRQIEHDQRSRRASLQGFQAAIETVRARLDLIEDGISAARLEMEQEEARRSELSNTILAILAVILGVSQVVVLTRQQLGIMALSSVPLSVALVLLLRWLRRAGKRRKPRASRRWPPWGKR